jgi:cyclase
MLKKRVIGCVNVRNGLAVQSFNFNKYLPLGKPECLVENLDRWGADEIILNNMDLSFKGTGPDLVLLEKIAKLGIETPLIYSGGIRNLQDGKDVIQTGADRICVTKLLLEDKKSVYKLSDVIGLQGLVGAVPIGIQNNELYYYDYLKRNKTKIKKITEIIDTSAISELLLIDYKAEGNRNAFNEKLIDSCKNTEIPLILFGGITEPEQIKRILRKNKVSAICIGNSLSYKENKIQEIKKNIAGSKTRSPQFRQQGKINV